MAKYDLNFPDDFLSDLLQTEPVEIIEEALTESVPILIQSMKDTINSVTVEQTASKAAESIEASKPKRAKNGAWIINANPRGYSENTYYGKGHYKVSNALKLIWLNYGQTAHNQTAREWLIKSTRKAEQAVMKKIQEVYDRRVKK